jgi:hypothetical protein
MSWLNMSRSIAVLSDSHVPPLPLVLMAQMDVDVDTR